MSLPIESFARASAAYGRVGKAETGASGAEGADGGFAGMVKRAIDDAVTTSKASEQASLGAVAGQGDLTHVVTAVAEAETALQTVVAVRDRVIEAYKDIMRMPI